MIPIFSLRSLLSLFIGLVVGAGLGLGYSSFSNADAELKASWPPIQIVRTPDSTLYETTMQGRMMPRVMDDTYLKNMDSEGQYYAARMSSLPFFEYFNNSISKQNPQYAHKPEDLSKMITVTYVTLTNNPSAIEIKARGTSSEETLFMLQTLPRVFEDYLLNEQNSLQAEIYQNKLKQIDITRTKLLQAEQDLIKPATQDITAPTTLTKDYIELSTKIATLQEELNNQAKVAANLLAQGFTPASQQPNTPSSPSIDVYSENTNPVLLAAQIKALEDALAYKERAAVGYSPPPDTPTYSYSISYSITDEALNQAYQQAIAQMYTNTIKAMERISTELSIAKVEMDKLQAKAIQEKAANDSTNEQKKLAYALANAQITSLTAQLDSQNKDLLATNQTVPTSQNAIFYTSAAPGDSSPINPNKNAPILGAVTGMFCSWLVINRKWLAGRKHTSSVSTKEDEDQGFSLPANRIDSATEISSETESENDDDWLNAGIDEASESTIKKEDDNWLNAGIDKASESILKKEDDDWLKTEITKPIERPVKKDEPLLNTLITNPPEILIKKDNSLVNIVITMSPQSTIKQEQTLINIAITMSPQGPVKKDEAWLNTVITKPPESPISQASSLLDAITIKPVESPVSQASSLLDAITIKPSGGPVKKDYSFLDAIITKPPKIPVKKDETSLNAVITKPAESPVKKEVSPDTIVSKAPKSSNKKSEDLLHPAINQVENSPFLKRKEDDNPWSAGKLVVTLEGHTLMEKDEE